MDTTEFYKHHRYPKPSKLSANPNIRGRFKFVLNKIEKMRPHKANVLDIGAEDGNLLRKLKTDWEITPHSIELSGSKTRKLRSAGIHTVTQDISKDKIEFSNNIFDITIMTEVVEHLFDCQHALSEIYRLTKPGGYLFLSTPNTFNAWMRVKFSLGRIPSPSYDINHSTKGEHIRLFNNQALTNLIRQAGFEEIQRNNFFKLRQFTLPTPILSNILSTHLFYIARKPSKT